MMGLTTASSAPCVMLGTLKLSEMLFSCCWKRRDTRQSSRCLRSTRSGPSCGTSARSRPSSRGWCGTAPTARSAARGCCTPARPRTCSRAAPAHRPEVVRVLALVGDDDLAARGDELDLLHHVGAEAVLCAEPAVAAVGQEAAEADGAKGPADDHEPAVARRRGHLLPLVAGAGRDGGAGDGEGAALRPEAGGEPALAVEVAGPDRERVRLDGSGVVSLQ